MRLAKVHLLMLKFLEIDAAMESSRPALIRSRHHFAPVFLDCDALRIQIRYAVICACQAKFDFSCLQENAFDFKNEISSRDKKVVKNGGANWAAQAGRGVLPGGGVNLSQERNITA